MNDQFLSDFQNLYTKLFLKGLVIYFKYKKIYILRGVKGRVIPHKPHFFMKNGILGGLTPQKGVILTSNQKNNILIKFNDPENLQKIGIIFISRYFSFSSKKNIC